MADANAMNGLLGKIYAIMTAPSTIQNAVTRRYTSSSEPLFISYCSPGIAISDIDFGDLTTADQVRRCSAFSDLVNSIPVPSGIWQKTDKKTWDIYEQALTQVKLAIDDLSDKERVMLKKAEDFLRIEVKTHDPFTDEDKLEVRPSPQLTAFEKMFTAYTAAIKLYNNTKITAVSNPTPEHVQDWTNNGPTYEQAVLNAYDNWGSLGYRDYVQKANGIISNLTARGSEALYDRLRGKFRMAEKKDMLGYSFYPTFAFPPQVLSPSYVDGWTKFSFSHSEINQFESASSSSWGGGVGVSFGLWSVGGSAQYTNSQTHNVSDSTGLGVEVELIQIPISRPWWSEWIFSSRGWKGVGPLHEEGSISSGPPEYKGLMPLIPTSMIVARNLVVNCDMTHDENKTFASTVNTSASVGWGPFSIRGNYSSSKFDKSHDYESSTSGLTAKGCQIIAFICEVVPKSPYPDPDLKWPSKKIMDEDAIIKAIVNGGGWL